MFLRRVAFGCLLLISTACAQLPRPYLPSEPDPHYFLYQDHIRIYYEDVGQGEPLILLHGFGETHATWGRLAPQLARRYRVISVDLKGMGFSDKPDDGRYRVADQAAIIDALADELRLKDVTLIGHSLGGGVALMTALLWQERESPRLKRLVLIDSAGISDKPPHLISLLRWPVFGPLMFHLANPTVIVKQIFRGNYADPNLVSPELVEAYARSMQAPGGRSALIMTARQVIPENFAELVARYRSLEAPALVIWCRKDRILPVSDAGKFRDALPRADVRLMDGCGHSPQEERPAETLRAIERFLEKGDRLLFH
ncbi:MAG: alpha/beta fold hydrolase [Nitrospirae bacterium]|nr:alpha/beta fold hydrolase [Nitrospirota bacterium]